MWKLIQLFFQSSDSDDGKGGIASFLPKDQVWKWSDKGQKRSKGRVYHKVIERKDEKLGIGDSAVFLSTNCPDQPYIGRLESMWETASGTKNVGVRWYYHLAEIECTNAEDKQKIKKIKQPKVNWIVYDRNFLMGRFRLMGGIFINRTIIRKITEESVMKSTLVYDRFRPISINWRGIIES